MCLRSDTQKRLYSNQSSVTRPPYSFFAPITSVKGRRSLPLLRSAGWLRSRGARRGQSGADSAGLEEKPLRRANEAEGQHSRYRLSLPEIQSSAL
ncbi:hypothetical protein AAFF_G00310650 [Aldrovandia affinis]|uniref:Uncharacterized protein n=1 Tax=Aldrovandia affinis TaxID=143900 RepID=A0AAD7W0K2_9TELE|nr:hypothetical protein AAFF_G00310650 [Aldrovandia affinis]